MTGSAGIDDERKRRRGRWNRRKKGLGRSGKSRGRDKIGGIGNEKCVVLIEIRIRRRLNFCNVCRIRNRRTPRGVMYVMEAVDEDRTRR